MPKRLVLGRTVNLSIRNKRIIVPEGEVWRASVLGAVAVNGVISELTSRQNSTPSSNMILGGGAELTGTTAEENDSCSITGLAFKLQEV